MPSCSYASQFTAATLSKVPPSVRGSGGQTGPGAAEGASARPRLEHRGRINGRRSPASSFAESIATVSAYDTDRPPLRPVVAHASSRTCAFYVDEARRSGGPVLELAVGTGRIAVPIAASGRRGDRRRLSAGMLAGRARARTSSPASRPLDLRYGDMRDPPVEGTFPLVLDPVPLVAAHGDRRRPARGAARGASVTSRRTGGSSSTSSRPRPTTSPTRTAAGSSASRGSGSAPTGTRRRARCPARARRDGEAEMSLAWLSVPEWRLLLAEEGFEVEALYGWFDRSPWAGGEDSIWICRATGLSLALPLVERDRAGRRDVQRLGAAIGIHASTSRSTSAGSPSRSAPSRNATRPRQVELGERRAAVRLERDARAVRRPLEPTGRAGRARSSRRSRAAPSARSGRRSRPTGRSRRRTRPRCGSACRRCPGRRAARARASPAAPPSPGGRRGGRRRSRAADAGRSRPPRAASRSTSSPARSRSTGSAVAASTASSPSTKKSPSLSRQRRSCSLRTSFSRSLSLRDDHAHLPHSSHSPWKSKTASRCRPPPGQRSTSSAKPSSSGAVPPPT